ncbi:MAG: hypothetical protein ACR2JC_10735 [Chloroflexota bacterium]
MLLFPLLIVLALVAIALSWLLTVIGGTVIDLNAVLGAVALVVGVIAVAALSLSRQRAEEEERSA